MSGLKPLSVAAGLLGTAVGTGIAFLGGGLRIATAVSAAAATVAAAISPSEDPAPEVVQPASSGATGYSRGARAFILLYFAYVVCGPIRRRQGARAERPRARSAAATGRTAGTGDAPLQERISRRVQTWAAANNHSLPCMLNDIILRLSVNGLTTLPPGASPEDIKRTYKRLLIKIHPDKVGQASEAEYLEATETFKVLLAAYRTSFAEV
eukprot:tig00020902_g14982.t2